MRLLSYLFFLLICTTHSWAKTLTLKTGQATYVVKHPLKTVKGESKELKGKIVCEKDECEFLIAIPVKSFDSGDASRDQNMLQTIEASSHPMTTANGKFPEKNLALDSWTMNVEIEFHGIRKIYEARMNKKGPQEFSSSLTIDLNQHKIERPSLLGMKIENTVPVSFVFIWTES